jgi:hypothetical protein
MKKLSILFVALLAATVSLTSCSKDDDNAETSIVGKWNSAKEGVITNGVELLTDYVHEAGCSKDYVEFKADKSFNDVSFDSSNPAMPCMQTTATGTFTRSGSQVTQTAIFMGITYSATATILNLTGTDLKVKYTDPDGTIRVETYTKG